MHERHSMIWEGEQDTARLKRFQSQPNEEVRHWYLATSQFTRKLASALTNTPQVGLDVHQQAALQATSALLVVLSFCHLEARTPEEAWPLVQRSHSLTPEDLAWIKLSNGKLAAQALTQGLTTDPVFRALVHIDSEDKNTLSLDLTSTPSIGFESLLELDQCLYSVEVGNLMNVQNSNCLLTIIFSFWSFIGGMTVEFEHSLRCKDPAALTILLYWYAKLNPLPVWWLKARTTLEGQAICKYLDRYHGRDPMIKRLLYWPLSILCPR
jgi:hypothetical protein